jgi:hypothetical protein
MSTVLVLAGLGLLALPGITAPAARQLQASEWRRLNRVAIGLGLAMVQLGLVLTAVPVLADAAGVEHLAHECHHLRPAGELTGTGAAPPDRCRRRSIQAPVRRCDSTHPPGMETGSAYYVV